MTSIHDSGRSARQGGGAGKSGGKLDVVAILAIGRMDEGMHQKTLVLTGMCGFLRLTFLPPS
jgi:hypothetical protein